MRFFVSVRRPMTGFSLLIIFMFITLTESRLEPHKTNNNKRENQTEVVTEEIAITNHAIVMDIEASKEKNEDRTHVLTDGPITGNTVTKKLNKRHVTEETRDIIREVTRLEELLTFNPKREISFRVPPRKTVKEVPKQDRTQELIKLEEEEGRSEDAEKEPTKGNTTIVNETTEKVDVIRQLTEEEFEAVTTKNCSLAVMDDDSGPTDPGLASFPCKIALWFHGEFPKWIKTSNLVENLKLLSDEELDKVAETVCICNIIDIGDFCSTEVKMEAQRIIDRCPRNTITTRLYRVAESYFHQDANLYYGEK